MKEIKQHSILYPAPKALAHWEVDGSRGSVSGVPNSMYLFTGLKVLVCDCSSNLINVHISTLDIICVSYTMSICSNLLILWADAHLAADEEILISYGNKGNEVPLLIIIQYNFMH